MMQFAPRSRGPSAGLFQEDLLDADEPMTTVSFGVDEQLAKIELEEERAAEAALRERAKDYAAKLQQHRGTIFAWLFGYTLNMRGCFLAWRQFLVQVYQERREADDQKENAKKENERAQVFKERMEQKSGTVLLWVREFIRMERYVFLSWKELLSEKKGLSPPRGVNPAHLVGFGKRNDAPQQVVEAIKALEQELDKQSELTALEGDPLPARRPIAYNPMNTRYMELFQKLTQDERRTLNVRLEAAGYSPQRLAKLQAQLKVVEEPVDEGWFPLCFCSSREKPAYTLLPSMLTAR